MDQNPRTPRFLNQDGTMNVIRTPFSAGPLKDAYHSLLVVSWGQFLALIGGLYVLVNLVFGFGYFLCGADSLSGVSQETPFLHFLDCFFFSVQTLATIGYGRINPVGIFSNLLVAIEALVGLMGLALATGLFFSRFAKPTSRVIFSNRALISSIDGTPSLIFRVANQRANQIVEAKINVTMVKTEYTREGERFRNFHDLVLERSYSPIFAMTWLLVHPIDPSSPLYNKSKEDLVRDEAEVIATLTGIDETFSQTVHARFSYIPEDVIWNAKFQDVLNYTQDGKIHVNIKKIHDIVQT